MLGKTGSGKSSAGNIILGEKKFHASFSFESVTRNCEKREVTVLGRKISVIDTPGLFDTSLSEEDLKAKIKNCVQLAVPGPHAFLLVIRLDARFTAEERNTVKWIQENFGEDALKHTIVLFTHADQLVMPLDQFIKVSQPLEHLIKSCAGGYHSFNNVNSGDRFQAQKLVDKIDALVRKYYTNEMFQQAQEEINQKEEREKEEEERKIREREEQIREEERRRIERENQEMQTRLRMAEEARRKLEKELEERNRISEEIRRLQEQQNRTRQGVNNRKSGESSEESSGTCCRKPSGTVIGLLVGITLAIVVAGVTIPVAIVYKIHLLAEIAVPIGFIFLPLMGSLIGCICKIMKQPREGERQHLIN
uniref:AIG1-type G domain-containing protein n=1 Tax=Astyanax mexicanus TaxID=7994 RepID=A0A3B1JGK9_ASTMX